MGGPAKSPCGADSSIECIGCIGVASTKPVTPSERPDSDLGIMLELLEEAMPPPMARSTTVAEPRLLYGMIMACLSHSLTTVIVSVHKIIKAHEELLRLAQEPLT